MLQGDLFKRLSRDEPSRRVLRHVYYACGFCTFDKIVVVPGGANIIFWVVIFPFLLSALNVTRENTSDPAFVVSRSGKLFLLFGPRMVLSLFVSLAAEESMTKAVAAIHVGCQPDCAACLKLGVRKALYPSR
jgi:hypothetical protein